METANNLLRAADTSLTEVLAHLPDDACCLLVGSVAEGFSNKTSDIDVLAFNPRDGLLFDERRVRTDVADKDYSERFKNVDVPTQGGLLRQATLASGMKLQIEFVSKHEIEALKQSVRTGLQWIDAFSADVDESLKASTAGMEELNLDQLRLLHRAYTGIPIAGHDAVAAIRAPLTVARLGEYLVARRAMNLGPLMLDLQGLIERAPRGDIETQVLVANQILIELGSLVLASIGKTSVSAKHLFRLLRKHEATIGVPLIEDLCLAYRTIFRGELFDAATLDLRIANALDFVESRSPFVKAVHRTVGRLSITASI